MKKLGKAQREALQTATRGDTPRYALAGEFFGKVIDVYDGDTCRVALFESDFGGDAAAPRHKGGALCRGALCREAAEYRGPLVYVPVRLLGYDAPEMKVAEQKAFATEARDALRALILDKIVLLEVPPTTKLDPYGRVLGRVHVLATLDKFMRKEFRRLWCPRFFRPQRAAPADSGDELRLVVRGAPLAIPVTEDIPAKFSVMDKMWLTDVSKWMIENKCGKPYDGKKARSGWTPDELGGKAPAPGE